MNVFCSAAWLRYLDGLTGSSELYQIGLFQNNHVPILTDTIASYTPATFSGYSGLSSLLWGSAFVNGATQGESDAPPVSWTHNGGGTSNTIYGVYVVSTIGNLAYAERFSAPIVMSVAGDMITYTPKITLYNQ